MSGSSREEILANFQRAIRNVIPEEQDRLVHFEQEDNIQLAADGVPAAIRPDCAEMPSIIEESYQNHPNLNIRVFFLDSVIEIEVPQSLTVGNVKGLIYSETGIPPCQQELIGWVEEPEFDSTPLYNLNLPSVFCLRLINRERYSVVGGQQGDLPIDNSQTIYVLKVYNAINSKEYNFIYPGETNITQVKADTFALSHIPPRHQIWNGWPENVTDESILRELNLNRPLHCLTLQSSFVEEENSLDGSTERGRGPPPPMFINPADEDYSADDENSEVFAGQGEMLNDNISCASMPSLIPDNIEDETAGSAYFIEGYNGRYGQLAPRFYPGTLEQAIVEAAFRPASERKVLVVYLHHCGSALTNSFCTELLGLETVHQALANYFVVWGWDITNQNNKEIFLSSATRLLGRSLTESLLNLSIDLLPALVIISRSYTNTELMDVIYGNIGMNELLFMLKRAVDIFAHTQQIESKKEEERAARQRIKSEQDKAYQISLQIDRAKDEVKKQKMLLQSLEEERFKNEQEMKEKWRKAMESHLPDEPSKDNHVITFRFRSPKGEIFERRFLAVNKLKVLFNYLLIKGYTVEEYKIISPWPRRKLCSLNGETLLQDIFQCAQEIIILEEH